MKGQAPLRIGAKMRLILLVLIMTLGSSSALARVEAWSYKISYDAKAKVMEVEARLPSGSDLHYDEEGEPFFSKIEETSGKVTLAVKNGLKLPLCKSPLCSIRYSFDLGRALTAKISKDSLQGIHDVILFNPSLFLLRPRQANSNTAVELRMIVSKDILGKKTFFESGLFLSPKDSSLKLTTANHLDDLPWAIVGAYDAESFLIKGAKVDLAVIPSTYRVTAKEIRAWCERATAAVVAYYGEFPVNHVLVIVVPRDVYNGPGKSFGDGGAVTINPLSLKAEDAQLRKDWVMTHEMVHLAFPSVPYRHHWIEEGLATYVEPIARIRTGELSAETVFQDMVKGMPQGLPKKGDGGLDGPPSWSKTYWGGAVFALLADIEIRKQSKGKKGLEDALSAIVKAGGTMATQWELMEAFKVGDKATGLDVLTSLYARMKASDDPVDLDRIWKELGVIVESDSKIKFDDKAPLAFVRKGIILGSGH
jgi:hypothetical protein